MLSIPASVRIFIHREPVDFRKSHDGLSGIIRRDLKEDPLSGDLFAFLNKRRDRVKLIQFDGNGLWLHYKRLENGTFRRPTVNADGTARYARADLALLLEGIEVKKGKLMRRFADSMRIPERTSDGANHRSTGTVTGTPPPRTWALVASRVADRVSWRRCAGDGVRQETGEMKGMKESYIEELATHFGPESCVPVREDRRTPKGRVGIEALTGGSMGRVLSRDIGYIEEADVLLSTEGNIGMRKGRSNARLGTPTPPRSETSCTCGLISPGTGRSRVRLRGNGPLESAPQTREGVPQR